MHRLDLTTDQDDEAGQTIMSRFIPAHRPPASVLDARSPSDVLAHRVRLATSSSAAFNTSSTSRPPRIEPFPRAIPEEIILAIVRCNLPPCSPESYLPRYRLLTRVYGRLSKAWYRVAQLELHRHVVLKTPVHAQRWLQVIASTDSVKRSWRFNTVALTLGTPDGDNEICTPTGSHRLTRIASNWSEQDETDHLVTRIVKHTPSLRRAWLYRCRFDPSDLSVAVELTTLVCSNCELVLGGINQETRHIAVPCCDVLAWHLPRLRALELHHCLMWSHSSDSASSSSAVGPPHPHPEVARILFNPSSVPSLVNLALSLLPTSMPLALDLLSPQLESLWITRTPLQIRPRSTQWPLLPEFGAMPNLRHFAIDVFGGGMLQRDVPALASVLQGCRSLLTLRIDSLWIHQFEQVMFHNPSFQATVHSGRMRAASSTSSNRTQSGRNPNPLCILNHLSQLRVVFLPQIPIQELKLTAHEEHQATMIRDETTLLLHRRGIRLSNFTLEFAGETLIKTSLDSLEVDPGYNLWHAFVGRFV
ncbi:BQ5605_C023g09667 [Microbotryum silenes-dioicae]|uniref:BQ5605_C023g09667 protein n=1 Tax=Microbotryum silenes-dioicae TaxID=796604 RepID=A0A2X0NDX8_9BASI|nr:BQ5605_C023g09667 [Microbotryum silenes-dioicae]